MKKERESERDKEKESEKEGEAFLALEHSRLCGGGCIYAVPSSMRQSRACARASQGWFCTL